VANLGKEIQEPAGAKYSYRGTGHPMLISIDWKVDRIGLVACRWAVFYDSNENRIELGVSALMLFGTYTG
jgi:hypothetical protein